MKILAIDTSLSACSLAIYNPELEHPELSFHMHAPMQQAQIILPELKNLLHRARLNIKNLDAIALGIGPGSFTGLRIASSVVQALSYVSKCSIIKVSTLQALAQTVFDLYGHQKIAIALDAHTQMIYFATYVINKHGIAEIMGKEQLLAPGSLNQNAISQDFVAVGSGWIKYHTVLCDTLRLTPNLHNIDPYATSILKLVKLHAGTITHFTEAYPSYLR